jgi:plastocyanin
MLALCPGAASSASQTVGVGNGGDRFTPRSVSIGVGETVTFRWSEGGHNVAVHGGPEAFDSGYRGAGSTYTHTFTRAGTYTFVCDAHQPEMRGTVTVGGAAAAAPAPAAARPRGARHRSHRARRSHRAHRRAHSESDD